MKIHGVLYLIILFAFDTCYCKCDEYIIILKETANPMVNFEPMKVSDVMNILNSYHNSTGIYKLYNELDIFKDCILEMECKGYSSYCPKKNLVTNHGKHSEELTNSTMNEVFKTVNDTNVFKQRESEYIENNEKSLYDLNIIYLNQNHVQNNTDLFDNYTKNTMLMICVFAENSCDDDDLYEMNLNISNDNAFNETMKDLVITLKRDEGSVIQPIFTGFASQNFTTMSRKNTFLEVTFICKYKENTHCKRKFNNSSKEIVSVPNNSINLYLKNDYIKHGTKIKYTGCEKDSGEINNTFNIQCDATNFTHINQDVLFILTNSSEHNETSNLHCQVTESYLSPKSVSKNGYNSLRFHDCYSNQNINNRTNFGEQELLLFLKRKRVDNITINADVESNKTKVPITSTKDEVNMNEENLFKMHITTDKRNNCSTKQLFSITEGQVIDEGIHFINENILKYDDVELKVINCFNETYSFNNNTKTYGQQSKLVIIFKNESDNYKIEEEFGELSEAISVILVCHQTYSDENEHDIDSNDKIVFDCESLNVNNDTTTEMNLRNILPSVSTKEETIHSNEGNRSHVNIENKHNCSSNATAKTYCAPKCDSENVDECHNISLNDMNKIIDKNDLSSTNNLTVGNKKTNDSQSNGHDNLTIENGDTLERIGLILLVSVAGTALLLAFALRIFARRGQYRPAPVREPQDLEETAF